MDGSKLTGVVNAKCVHGCTNERDPADLACPDHWRIIPRAMRVEFHEARKAAMVGRGRKNNGRNTPRLKAAIKAMVDFLIEKVSKPYAEAQIKKDQETKAE